MPSFGGGTGERFDLQGSGGSDDVTPSSGSSGFSSRVMVWGDANGALFNNTSGPVWDSTLNAMGIGASPTSAVLMLNPVPNSTMMALRVQGSSQASIRTVEFRRSGGPILSYIDDQNASTFVFGMVGAGSTIFQIAYDGSVGLNIHKDGSAGFNTTEALANLMVQGSSNTEVVRFAGRSSAGTTLGPAFCIKSTGTTQTIGFWSSVGSVRIATSFVNGATAAGRTVPTTQSTVVVAAVSTAQYVALANGFNQMVGVVSCLIKQLGSSAGYGLIVN